MDIMLDIETMGKGPFAAIIAIGAVKFNPLHLPETEQELRDTTDKFYARVSLASSMRVGMRTDASTIEWWLDPKRRPAYDRLMQDIPEDLHNALSGLNTWMEPAESAGESPVGNVWGNGSMFDNTIMGSAYQLCNIAPGWTYKQDSCFRTLKKLYPDIKPSDVGVAHFALDDALAQAWWAQRILARMRLGEQREAEAIGAV